MRARYREDVHDARRLEVRDEVLREPLIAAEQHGKDGRGIFLRHGALHARPVMFADPGNEAPECMAFACLGLRAALARHDARRDAVGAQQESCVKLAGILVAARQAHPARGRHSIADASDLIRHDGRPRVEIALPCGLLPVAARAPDLLHRHEIADLVDAAAIRQHRLRPARLIVDRAADLDLCARPREIRDVRRRQKERRLQPDDAECEEEQQPHDGAETVPAP